MFKMIMDQFNISELLFLFRPRGGVGSEPPQSSDSDEYSTTNTQQHSHGHGYGQGQVDIYNVPKVQVSGLSNNDESSSVING